MPVIIEWTYADGTKEIDKIPAEVWRTNESRITKVFIKQKEVRNIVLDPNNELTDVDSRDNVFPKTQQPSRFDEFKRKSK